MGFSTFTETSNKVGSEESERIPVGPGFSSHGPPPTQRRGEGGSAPDGGHGDRRRRKASLSSLGPAPAAGEPAEGGFSPLFLSHPPAGPHPTPPPASPRLPGAPASVPAGVRPRGPPPRLPGRAERRRPRRSPSDWKGELAGRARPAPTLRRTPAPEEPKPERRARPRRRPGAQRGARRSRSAPASRCPSLAAMTSLPVTPPAPPGAHPLAAMTGLPTTPSPAGLITTVRQVTAALSPEAEASTALIAVVITVVFLTLLSVVILIFFYLYKNKGSYVTYEPAEGEPSTILQMESDAAKGREKEEYFI
ncbi:small cell adhesion glycoprotein [Pipistrellus kuhlii]|nr:small cell adhesion glycoprotein [Pipistrellus kuhlii]